MTSLAAAGLVEQLVRAPRFSAVEAYDGATIVMRADVASQRTDRILPVLRCYRLEESETWSVAWSVRGYAAALNGDSAVAYATVRGGRHEIRRWEPTGEDISWQVLPGQLGAMAFDPATGDLACTVRTADTENGARRPTAFTRSDAAWFDDQSAALGTASHGVAVWQVCVLRTDLSVIPVAADDVTLTGELAWLSSGRLVLGAARYLCDGRRRFGLLVTDSRHEPRVVFDSELDLTSPVAAPDGSRLACVGTTVPTGHEPMTQKPCLLTDGDAVSTLDTGDDRWHRPVGWADPSRLCCVAEDGARRRLVVHHLSTGHRSAVSLSASVVDAAPTAAGSAVIVSSPGSPPVLGVVDHASGAFAEVQRTPGIEAPGRLRRVPLTDVETGLSLSAWLCEPPGPPRALAVVFHGGPLKSWTDWPWRWNPWPLVATGLTVALVDPPMSLGYGSAAVAAGWRRWRTGIAEVAARQVREVRRVTALQDAPLVLLGGSFGGYLALVTAGVLRPDLVVAHGSPGDLRHVASVSDVGWQWIREYGDPDTERDRYDDQSLPAAGIPPGTRVLLSHGVNDGLVPASESVRIHRSLVRQGIRSELVLFPGEAHPVSQPSNLMAWFAWILGACKDQLGNYRPAQGPT
ncbi:alpha/beta hydrolase family protein [Streptomyces sp. NPDC090045]|uniref:alpha/beta hydrolase family protein n=1 Tax=Streptomyces sp. NPDC090045 TaxID=3365927 RepID=UPI0037FC7F2A